MSSGQELWALCMWASVLIGSPIIALMYWWEERGGRDWWRVRRNR